MISKADRSCTSRTRVDFPYGPPQPPPAILGSWEATPASSFTQVLTWIRTRPCYLLFPNLTLHLTPPERCPPVSLGSPPPPRADSGTGLAPALQVLSLALWLTQMVLQ